jgi:hypothetical protein
VAKCPACTPAAMIRHEFDAAKKTAKKIGSCSPMQRVLAKMRPVVGMEAAGSPARAKLIFREMLSKENQTQKMCTSIAKANAKAAAKVRDAWGGVTRDASWDSAGMDGLRRRRSRRRRR